MGGNRRKGTRTPCLARLEETMRIVTVTVGQAERIGSSCKCLQLDRRSSEPTQSFKEQHGLQIVFRLCLLFFLESELDLYCTCLHFTHASHFASPTHDKFTAHLVEPPSLLAVLQIVVGFITFHHQHHRRPLFRRLSTFYTPCRSIIIISAFFCWTDAIFSSRSIVNPARLPA